MQARGIVTLTTDFGTGDAYVGQMKGAALAVAPALRLVDLCHQVPPQNVAAGSYLLETGYGAFPEGTIHLAVVDPGVGTARRAILARTDRYFFLAPDNGLLTRVLDREPASSIHVLQNAAYARADPSPTFAGRDVFAPAAGWIARGAQPADFGPPAGEVVRLPRERPGSNPAWPIRLPVVWIDHFGNAVVDLRVEELIDALGREPDSASKLRLGTPGGEVREFRRTYAGGRGAGPFLLINSAGYLEVAMQDRRADRQLDLEPGSPVELSVER